MPQKFSADASVILKKMHQLGRTCRGDALRSSVYVALVGTASRARAAADELVAAEIVEYDSVQSIKLLRDIY